MSARIYRPAKTAMQSGRARTHAWVLERAPQEPKSLEPLMGWTSSGDMDRQVILHFASAEEAVAYARRHGLDYVIEPAEDASLQIKSYADNFRYDRMQG